MVYREVGNVEFVWKLIGPMYDRITGRNEKLSLYLTPLFAENMRELGITTLPIGMDEIGGWSDVYNSFFAPGPTDVPEELKYGFVIKKLVLRKGGRLDAYVGSFYDQISILALTSALTTIFAKIRAEAAKLERKRKDLSYERARNRASWAAMNGRS